MCANPRAARLTVACACARWHVPPLLRAQHRYQPVGEPQGSARASKTTERASAVYSNSQRSPAAQGAAPSCRGEQRSCCAVAAHRISANPEPPANLGGRLWAALQRPYDGWTQIKRIIADSDTTRASERSSRTQSCRARAKQCARKHARRPLSQSSLPPPLVAASDGIAFELVQYDDG